ncbi:MAG TPA: transcriptional regulator [Acholeplasmatales bacterium]|nr:transcriptional regulator [Acholeplasmatales bacterium]
MEGIMHQEEASKLFKALGDESRVKIVKILYHNDEICACKFLNIVPCKQATLSHHLKVLFGSGLLTRRNEGTKILYSCNKTLVDELMLFIKTKCDCVGGK